MKKYCNCCGAEIIEDDRVDHDTECIWFDDVNNPDVERIYWGIEMRPDGKILNARVGKWIKREVS